MRTVLSALLAVILVVPANALDFLTPNVTRSEAAMIILQTRLPSVPDVRDTKGFPDVIPGSWYERYVVLAERYGILEADPATKRIRPDVAVRRWEFLKMLTYAFGMPDHLKQNYRDVPANTDAATYAGLAQMYGLFPGDKDKTLLRPNDELRHGETSEALWILSQVLQLKQQAMSEGKAMAVDQTTYNLQLYQKISSKTDLVTVQTQTVPTSAAGPRLVERQVPVIVRAGDDAAKLPALRTTTFLLINAERAKVGLPALRVSPTLEASAQLYAENMASRGFFGHVTPEGKTLRDRMESSGYYRLDLIANCPDCVNKYELGENLAQGQLTPAEAVRDWMASPTHRAAILSRDFSETGFGISAGIWVEHFGGRK